MCVVGELEFGLIDAPKGIIRVPNCIDLVSHFKDDKAIKKCPISLLQKFYKTPQKKEIHRECIPQQIIHGFSTS